MTTAGKQAQANPETAQESEQQTRVHLAGSGRRRWVRGVSKSRARGRYGGTHGGEIKPQASLRMPCGATRSLMAGGEAGGVIALTAKRCAASRNYFRLHNNSLVLRLNWIELCLLENLLVSIHQS